MFASSPVLGQSFSFRDTMQVRAVARWTLSVLPAARKLSEGVFGDHVWGAGAQFAIALRPLTSVSVSGALLVASTPQMNFKDQAVANEISPSLSVAWHPLGVAAWDPFISAGVAQEHFRVTDPPVGVAASQRFVAPQFGAGVQHALTSRIGWRAEFAMQTGAHGRSLGVFSGLSLRSSASRADAPRRVVVRDTVRIHDTTTVTIRATVHDTVIVRDTVVRERTREVTQFVKGGNVVVTLRDANFDFAKAGLRPEALPLLDDIARQLTEVLKDSRIRVVGHTDSVGSGARNMALGLGRARSVREYLALRGVAPDRVDVASGGRNHPIASNQTNAGRALNRRVVISLVP